MTGQAVTSGNGEKPPPRRIVVRYDDVIVLLYKAWGLGTELDRKRETARKL